MHMSAPLPQGVAISGAITPAFAEILSPEALGFVAKLHRKFESRQARSCSRRAPPGNEFDQGKLPDFLPQTKAIRDGDWVVAAQPKDMLDRRVEITGPTDRKMVINALNCGAATFMADFEDANCPTWHNMIDGQINIRDAVRRTITFEGGPDTSQKLYRLKDKTAVLIPRPRRQPRREARHRRRQAGVRRDLRFRAALLPQREGAARARLGPVLLPAEDGVAPRGALVERNLRVCSKS